jgi:hypothetical protein
LGLTAPSGISRYGVTASWPLHMENALRIARKKNMVFFMKAGFNFYY